MPFTALMVSSGCLTKVMTLEVPLVVGSGLLVPGSVAGVSWLGTWWDDIGSETAVVSAADVVAGGS